MEQYFQPPYPVDEIARWAVFQLLLVVGDLVMVRLRFFRFPSTRPLLILRLQIHRMYHIYNKSILACIIPSMSTSGLIGDSVLWLLPSGFSDRCFLAIGIGLTNSLRNLNTEAEYKACDNWTTACFCVTLL